MKHNNYARFVPTQNVMTQIQLLTNISYRQTFIKISLQMIVKFSVIGKIFGSKKNMYKVC